MPICAEHETQQVRFICIEKLCHDRLVCEECLTTKHHDHELIPLIKSIKQFSNIYRNCKKRNSIENKRLLKQYCKELQKKSLQIDKELKLWRDNVASNFFHEFTALYQTFSTSHFEWVWETLMNKGNDHENFVFYGNNDRKKDLEGIAREIKFLKNEIFEYPEKIMKAAEIIVKQVGASLQKCKQQIGSALLKLSKLMKQHNFNNIESILNSFENQEMNKEPNFQNLQKQPPKQPKQLNIIQDEEQDKVKKRRKLNVEKQKQDSKRVVPLTVFKPPEELIEKINPIKLFKPPTKQLTDENRSKPLNNISLTPPRRQNSIISSQESNSQNATFQIQQNQNSLKIVTKPDYTIFVEQIINFLLEHQESANITRFQISGMNEFNVNCLEILFHKFPNLVKLDYIFNFDEKGVNLIKEDIFPETGNYISESLMPINQDTLDLFGKFTKLENLVLGDISAFKQNLLIRNQTIKHLTVGVYKTKQIIQIPANLRDQTINFKLQTLNLFNIQSLASDFLSKVLIASPLLKQLWMSECTNLKSGFFEGIKNSRLQSLILEQLKIPEELNLPQTLQNLFIYYCSLSFSVRGIDRSRRGFKNFCIYQDKGNNYLTDNGNRIVFELSKSSATSLEYLNLGQNQALNDECMNYLGELIGLKYLLNSLIKGTNLKKLERLDISKNHWHRPMTEKLAQAFPNLTDLYLTKTASMFPQNFLAFKNLKNLTLGLRKQQQTQDWKIQLDQYGIKLDTQFL